jgi:Ca2+:H+ antiporter
VTNRERALLAGVLLVTALAGAARYLSGVPHVLAFVVAALALGGLAWTVSFSIEQVGLHYGPAVTGTLQATVGNLPEFFVVLFALQAHATTVAQTAIVGSIFVNALLVLGMVLLAGTIRSSDGVMRFSTRLPNDTATLMLVASFTIVLIGIATATHDAVSKHVETLSIVGAIAMLIVYGIWTFDSLRADGSPPESGEGPVRAPLRTALALLVAAGIGSAFVSDWLVHALEPTIHTLHISQTFAGIVIIAIAGNAVEHLAGIYLAARGHSDLAISVVKSSVAQIAAFLYPLLVLVSLLTASRLTFALQPVWIGALLGTTILMWQITTDGEGTRFEGAALMAMYVVIAVVALFEH